jgi:uncharacterized membrane protein YuzA (DUF378 family)
MKKLDVITAVLVIVGGLNWGSVGVFGTDLVASLFGQMSVPSRVVYTLVGLSAFASSAPVEGYSASPVVARYSPLGVGGGPGVVVIANAASCRCAFGGAAGACTHRIQRRHAAAGDGTAVAGGAWRPTRVMLKRVERHSWALVRQLRLPACAS